jgi:hypothetical protein
MTDEDATEIAKGAPFLQNNPRGQVLVWPLTGR